ncbi:TIGR03087 family PEP-CTERM/XrtA system glycosyltransferase [Teredinibacter purpureus]|uniref:TIGR03087 family PEP-CTERM/XrtA system glycosyltransferase n=1 Tax=Teredinibacter purpureus TaxID=2731756 RepID=UPI0005F7AFF9|nr:TIGR03087 family PEP-CTERM/XrtA system glycosyltransferase [Teredinibacter purpureus]
MDIAVLAHRVPYPPNKGEKIRTFHQIKYLAERGHTVHLFCPIESSDDRANLLELKKIFCASVQCAQKPSALSHIVGLVTHKPLSVSNFYTRELQQRFDKALIEQLPDAVICTSSSMAEYVFRSKPLQAVRSSAPKSAPKLVMDFMDLDSDKWRQYQDLKRFPLNLIYWRESKLLGEYERKVHHQFDASLFISPNEIELFLQNTQDEGKLHTIANGLDTESFKPGTQEKPLTDPIFLFTGVMDYLPNVDAVCWFVEHAWTDIRTQYPDAKFYVAGMNPNAKVMALKKYPGIVITGFVDDIHQYFNMAHIFVAPFRIARGVQNKVLQAMASGLPTVATPVAAEGISCTHEVDILVGDTIPDLVQHIHWLVANPDASTTLAKNAVALVQREFSWEGKLAELEKILQP